MHSTSIRTTGPIATLYYDGVKNMPSDNDAIVFGSRQWAVSVARQECRRTHRRPKQNECGCYSSTTIRQQGCQSGALRTKSSECEKKEMINIMDPCIILIPSQSWLCCLFFASPFPGSQLETNHQRAPKQWKPTETFGMNYRN